MGMMTVWRRGQEETGPAAAPALHSRPDDRSGPATRLLTIVHNSKMRSRQKRESRAAGELRGRCAVTAPAGPSMPAAHPSRA